MAFVTTREAAKGVIIAQKIVNDRHPMDDYDSLRVEQGFVLAYSSHSRRLFKEMRLASLMDAKTEHLNGVEGVEYREDYAFGKGYYLAGGLKTQGWRIVKRLPQYANSALPVGYELPDSISYEGKNLLARNAR